MYIMYSENSDGSNMVSTPTALTKYRGVAFMPDDIATNPNLLDNSDFRNGMTNWSADGAIATISNGEMKIISDPELPSNIAHRVIYNTRLNPFSTVSVGENLYSYFEAKVDVSGKLAVGQIGNSEFKQLTTSYQGQTSVMPKTTENTLSLVIESNDSVYVRRISAYKNPVNYWKPSPSDWLNDRTNYVWTNFNNPYVMYSANANGSNMVPVPTPETKYKGISTMPNSISEYPNLLRNTDFKILDSNDVPKYYTVSPLIRMKKTNVSSEVVIGIEKTETSSTRNGIFQSVNFTQKDANIRYFFTYQVSSDAVLKDNTTAYLRCYKIDGTFFESPFNFNNASPGSWSNVSLELRTPPNEEISRLEVGIMFDPTATGTIYFYHQKMFVAEANVPAPDWSISPADWASNPGNYLWTLIPQEGLTKYVRYSASPDGSNMVEVPTPQTIYRGIAYIPDSIGNNSQDWLADKANYTWTLRDTTATRYSTTIDGAGMTTDKRPESKYIGMVTVPESLYENQNLLKDSAYYDNKSPRFTNLYPANSRTETVVLDGYRCTKVELDATTVVNFKGVYISDNMTNLYSQFQPNDLVVFSFMIKGNIKWATSSPQLEKSTTFSIQNRKDSYANWERVIWTGKKNDIGGAFIFYTQDLGAYTFYLRDICIQKATEFTGYKIAPQEFITNPYNYNWEPIEKTVIKYSNNYDGSGMTSFKRHGSRFMGIANIPQELYKNANLLTNPEFIDGTKRWIGTNGSTLKIVSSLPSGLPSIPEIGTNAIENINKLNASAHTTQEIPNFPQGIYTLSAYVLNPSNDVPGTSITKWRFPEGIGFVEPEVKTTNTVGQWKNLSLTVDLKIQDRYVFGIAGSNANPNQISLYSWHPKLEKGSVATPWTPSIEDWLNDPKNYTWISLDNEVVRYSPNSSGSNMTEGRRFDSRYRGIGYIPLDLYVNENLMNNTNKVNNIPVIKDSILPPRVQRVDLSWVEGYKLKITSNNTNDPYFRPIPEWTDISKLGEELTLSFKYQTSPNADSRVRFSNSPTTTTIVLKKGTSGEIKQVLPNNNNIYERYYLGFDPGITADSVTSTIGEYITIWDLKIESGSAATPWTQSTGDWLTTPSNYTWTELPDVLKPEHVDNVDGMFPLTNVRLSNGIYYHINITRDTTLSYTRDIPGWTYYTILDAKFNNTLNGGNTNILLSQLEGLVIKRRRIGTFKWVTLKEIKINSPADLNVVYQDSFLPSLHEFEYALVPILNGNIEGEYVTNTINTKFNGVFISDRNTIFKLYNAVAYGMSTGNKASAYIPTIGNKYPTYISNSTIDYRTGQVSSLLLGYKFEKTRNIDRLDVVTQTNDLIDFLNSGEAKVITDWNGNIELVRVDANPTISYNSSYGNGVDTVSFNWTEQGKYDEQEDLYYNGLVDTIG